MSKEKKYNPLKSPIYDPNVVKHYIAPLLDCRKYINDDNYKVIKQGVCLDNFINLLKNMSDPRSRILIFRDDVALSYKVENVDINLHNRRAQFTGWFNLVYKNGQFKLENPYHTKVISENKVKKWIILSTNCGIRIKAKLAKVGPNTTNSKDKISRRDHSTIGLMVLPTGEIINVRYTIFYIVDMTGNLNVEFRPYQYETLE